MQSHQINHYSTYSIVERFNRTLEGMLWKEFSYQAPYKWINIYQDLGDTYNNTLYRTINMTPNEVNSTNGKHLLDTIFSNLKISRKPEIKVGDNVRISKYEHIFEKGYTPNWKSEIFKIKRVRNTNPNTHILEGYQGYDIQGDFYEF